MLGCLGDFMIFSAILEYKCLDDPKGIDGYDLSH